MFYALKIRCECFNWLKKRTCSINKHNLWNLRISVKKLFPPLPPPRSIAVNNFILKHTKCFSRMQAISAATRNIHHRQRNLKLATVMVFFFDVWLIVFISCCSGCSMGRQHNDALGQIFTPPTESVCATVSVDASINKWISFVEIPHYQDGVRQDNNKNPAFMFTSNIYL